MDELLRKINQEGGIQMTHKINETSIVLLVLGLFLSMTLALVIHAKIS